MIVKSKNNEDGTLEISLIFDSHDQACLNHDLIDIVDWFSKGPSLEKINNCKKRMIKEYKEVLLKDESMQRKTLSEINGILADEKSLVQNIISMNCYKSRKNKEDLGKIPL